MKKTIYILVGIPCSGKSTWLKRVKKEYDAIVSRDAIRLHIYGKDYKPTTDKEEYITFLYNDALNFYLTSVVNVTTIYLDNTHCKEKYINEILNKYKDYYNIKIKFFEIPLWWANIRNIIRRIQTGKWIPFSVMSNMYKNYKKLNKEKYAEYLVH